MTGVRPALVALTLLLVACRGTAPITPAPSAAAPAGAMPAAAPGSTVYRVDSAASELRVLVRRAGALAGLGHNHVLVSHALDGTIAWHPEPARTRFRLTLPVASFLVDPPAARSQEGVDFAGQLDAEAVAGTRANLLGPKVLDAARFPRIVVQSVTAHGPGWQPDVTVAITVHGVTRRVEVPVALSRDATGLGVTARFTLRQSNFGITPFAVLGGALRVDDVLTVRLRLRARRADNAGAAH